ncbi:MAG: YncE family protein, partial [Maioricimonas sp. JB049]
MNLRTMLSYSIPLLLGLSLFLTAASPALADDGHTENVQRRLYVATPGIRNYLEYGGHGLLVFDIDNGHRFIRRIPTGGLDENGKPLNVKGICASAKTGRLYISTIRTLQCLDLVSEKLLWERPYEGGCDRMSLSPDGRLIYQPSFETDHWHVLDAMTGDVI